MENGTVVKIKFNDLKHYAVVAKTNDDGSLNLRTITASPKGIKVINLNNYPAADVRETSTEQADPVFALIRQCTGIRREHAHPATDSTDANNAEAAVS